MNFNNETKKKHKLLQKLQCIKGIARDAFSNYGNLTYIKITLREI